jgi:hypothetical protein
MPGESTVFKSTITEYYTASHAVPMVIVPKMGLFYLKGDTQGYHFRALFSNYLPTTLEKFIANNGDFSMSRMEAGGWMIKFFNARRLLIITVAYWEEPWNEWWSSFLKIQRMLNYVLRRRHAPSLKTIKAFQESDRANVLPSEIILHITKCYFEHQSHQKCSQKSKIPVRTVEANSFKMQRGGLAAQM